MFKALLILASSALLWAQQSMTWNGTLLDDSCHSTDATAKCEVNDQTKMFGVKTADGKYYKLDIDGSAKVREALNAQKKTGTVAAAVTGLLDGETIKVSAVQIR